MLCTGCTACANKCPKHCIVMRSNDEGFLYPQIDEKTCIDCNICQKVCPVNHHPEGYTVKKGYVARNKDLNVLKDSTSGGFCSAFANYIFLHDGVLFGVGLDKNMKVCHFSIEKNDKTGLEKMRGSKYVQSNLGSCFKECKELLMDGRYVGFIGTPCQIAGLKAFLGECNFEKLFTVDLVCRGVSSPLVFENYVNYMTSCYNSKLSDIRFRNKTYGYHSSTMMVAFDNGGKYYGSGRVDFMLKAYFSGACSRYSCYSCPFKGMDRYGDLTVFDCWHAKELIGIKDDDQGFTNIFVSTSKGDNVLAELRVTTDLWEADPQLMRELDGAMITEQAQLSNYRSNYIKEIQSSGFYETSEKYMPISAWDYFIERLKIVVYKTPFMNILRSLKKKIQK